MNSLGKIKRKERRKEKAKEKGREGGREGTNIEGEVGDVVQGRRLA